MARIECPECGRPADDQDFACSHCELILNAEAPAGRYVLTNPSIVRALISPPDYSSGHDKEIPKPPAREASDDQVTVVRHVMLSGEEVPRLVAGLDVALAPLHPFEAYVVSFFDGATSANDAALAAQLRRVEMNAVLSSLLERKVVVLEPARPARPPGATPPPPRAPVPAATPRPAAPAPALTAAQVPLAVMRPVRIASRTTPPALPLPEPKPEPKPEPARAPAPAPGAQRRIPLDAVPQDPVKNALTRALAMEKRGQVDQAIEVLKLGISKLDKPASLYNKLALILLDQRRDFSQAEELLQKALEIEPENSVYQQNLFRVISRAASAGGSDKKPSSSGFLSKLWKK